MFWFMVWRLHFCGICFRTARGMVFFLLCNRLLKTAHFVMSSFLANCSFIVKLPEEHGSSISTFFNSQYRTVLMNTHTRICVLLWKLEKKVVDCTRNLKMIGRRIVSHKYIRKCCSLNGLYATNALVLCLGMSCSSLSAIMADIFRCFSQSL